MKNRKKSIVCVLLLVASIVLCSCGQDTPDGSGLQTLSDICVRKTKASLSAAQSVSVCFSYVEQEQVGDAWNKLEERSGEAVICLSETGLDYALSLTNGGTYLISDGTIYEKGETDYEEISVVARENVPLNFLEAFESLFPADLFQEDFWYEFSNYLNENAARSGDALSLNAYREVSVAEHATVYMTTAFEFEKKTGLKNLQTSLFSDKTFVEGGDDGDAKTSVFRKSVTVSFVGFGEEDLSAEVLSARYPLLEKEDFFTYKLSKQKATLRRVKWSISDGENGGKTYSAEIDLVYQAMEYKYVVKAEAKEGKTDALEMEIVDYKRFESGREYGLDELTRAGKSLVFEARFDWENAVADFSALPIIQFWTENY